MRWAAWIRKIPRRIKLTAAIFYFAILLDMVFFARRRWHNSVRSVYLVPFKSTIRQFHEMGVTNPFKFYTDFFGNIFGFVPICFAMKVFFPRIASRQIVLFGFLLSVSIEVLQYIFRDGYSEMDDVILNTFGTVLGVWIFNRIFSSGSPSSPPRQGAA